MTTCPWPPAHPCTPDPADLGLGLGEVGMCETCACFYTVVKVAPYALKRAYAQSALPITALARQGQGLDPRAL